jgi:transcriptional regulator with XRE-family HTH domain
LFGFLFIANHMATKDKDKFFKQFGAHIKKIRKEKGLSIREMELRGDIDRHTLSKIENGKLNCGVYSVKKLCDALEISMEELFKGL